MYSYFFSFLIIIISIVCYKCFIRRHFQDYRGAVGILITIIYVYDKCQMLTRETEI